MCPLPSLLQVGLGIWEWGQTEERGEGVPLPTPPTQRPVLYNLLLDPTISPLLPTLHPSASSPSSWSRTRHMNTLISINRASGPCYRTSPSPQPPNSTTTSTELFCIYSRQKSAVCPADAPSLTSPLCSFARRMWIGVG